MMKIYEQLLVLVLGVSSVNSVCQDGFVDNRGYCFHEGGQMSYDNAVEYCSNLGGATLAYPWSNYTAKTTDLTNWQEAVKEFFGGSKGYLWVGARQRNLPPSGPLDDFSGFLHFFNDDWTWVDFTNVSSAAWREGDPGSSPENNDTCARVHYSDGLLSDVSCDIRVGALCQDFQHFSLVGNQCLEFVRGRKIWEDAKADCVARQGVLASLDDPQAVLDYVRNDLGGGLWWVGASDIETRGTFYGSNRPHNFQWLANQACRERASEVPVPWANGVGPSNWWDEDCLGFDSSGYRSYACSDTDIAYICEPKDYGSCYRSC